MKYTYVSRLEGMYQVPVTSIVQVRPEDVPPGAALFDSEFEAKQAARRKCNARPLWADDDSE